MVNAQKWLDQNYPKETRNEITKLEITGKDLEGKLELTGFFKLTFFTCGDNKLTDLNLSDCRELTELYCWCNQLTNTNFLTTLPSPEKLIRIDMGDNNFNSQDLSFLRPFTGMESLQLWTCDQKRIDQGIYNRFYGSLKYLRNMSKLRELGISNTDIDSGLEYLMESKLEKIPSEWFSWGENSRFGKRKGAKAEKIYEELRPYVVDLKKGKYNLLEWEKVKLIELKLENEQLRNKNINQKSEIERLSRELKITSEEMLARKKKEFEQLVNSEKGKLDEDLQDYLEIFLSSQKENNIGKLAKKNLTKKISERELEKLFDKKQEVDQLENKLNNLKIQEDRWETSVKVQIPSKK